MRTNRLLVEGRNIGHLSFGHKKIHHFEIEKILRHFSTSIAQYQLMKDGAGRAVLRIEPTESFRSPYTTLLCHTIERQLCITLNIELVKSFSGSVIDQKMRRLIEEV